MMYSSSQGGFQMIDTCVLHDDYENFAQKFLGVDYEDYIGLQLGLPDEDELENEYPLGVWFLLEWVCQWVGNIWPTKLPTY